ncbi:TIM-barrel protein, nifR3 family [Leptotrichia wadei]|jgi:dihydrouridine synthase duS|uniref:tRNA-dihydrouridine synthase n=1 Tax=Leptotrichia wadei TaxID=157687 RepID=A0A134AB12_9FUSO|nr:MULTISPECIES: tRNA-dihydrouridine synthase family protein [Leptotrichia]KXB64838.1 TIM-barrel protein, nifR3 family [Leptotrichia wadei]
MKIYTAPMAGITDYSFRKILKKFEPDFMFTEMVNANLLNREDGTTVNELLKCDEKEKTGTQIFGGDRNELVSGIFKLKDFGFRKININMGCPQPKITKNGAGSALLENFELVEEVLLETKDIEADISLKIRVGYREFQNPEIFLKLANKYNLDFICVHGRTQEQMYSGTANWEIVERLSKMPRNIEFFGNGDLFDPFKIEQKISFCNLDGIILSRGIIGNPWLILQTREFLKFGKINTIQTFDETKSIVLEHLENIEENKGKIKAVLEINKFLRPYFKKFWEKNLNKNSEIVIVEDFYDENLKGKIDKIILEKEILEKIKMIKQL